MVIAKSLEQSYVPHPSASLLASPILPNTPRGVDMVSMGVRYILLLIKCVKILDLIATSLSNPIPTSFLHDESPFGTLTPPCSLTTSSTCTLRL